MPRTEVFSEVPRVNFVTAIMIHYPKPLKRLSERIVMTVTFRATSSPTEKTTFSPTGGRPLAYTHVFFPQMRIDVGANVE